MPHARTRQLHRVPRRLIATALALVATVGLTTAVAGSASAAGPGASAADASVSGLLGKLVDFGCANPANHFSRALLPATATTASSSVRCFGTMRASASSTPTGLTPLQIRTAYRLGGTTASGRIVAIIDAYDNPNAEADLAVYRKHFNLPPCTTANGCFRKLNQDGNVSPLPTADPGWGQEIALDLDAVSATCPSCKIRLIEADSPDNTPLMTAVRTAVRVGYKFVSNSYGGDEDATIRNDDPNFRHPGIAFTASSGDDGYGAQWPASSPYVTAVGGTTLRASSASRGWTETAWSGAGSGCSKYEPKPPWQKDTRCSRRTVADVSAVADPATGLAVYGTYNNCLPLLDCDAQLDSGSAQGLNGWAQVGGTSLSAPVVAAVYATAGRAVTYATYPYTHRSGLFDVRAGSNGSCGGTYLCSSTTGYDGPTGLGTPNGTGSF